MPCNISPEIFILTIYDSYVDVVAYQNVSLLSGLCLRYMYQRHLSIQNSFQINITQY